jgi:hypothetical protein
MVVPCRTLDSANPTLWGVDADLLDVLWELPGKIADL